MKQVIKYSAIFMFVIGFGLSYWAVSSISLTSLNLSIPKPFQVENPAPRCVDCIQNNRLDRCLKICAIELMNPDFIVIKANNSFYSAY